MRKVLTAEVIDGIAGIVAGVVDDWLGRGACREPTLAVPQPFSRDLRA
jgi:hypothetical protein